jgi:hypothetical protein
VLVVVYVAMVAWIMQHAQEWFRQTKTVLAPTAFLLLFVLTAAVVGGLVVGRPVLLYADGQKKEALKFFGFTILWLFVLTIDLLYPPLLPPIVSCNLLLYQSLPTSIPYRHAMWRRRKDDTGVGTAASGLIA